MRQRTNPFLSKLGGCPVCMRLAFNSALGFGALWLLAATTGANPWLVWLLLWAAMLLAGLFVAHLAGWLLKKWRARAG